MESFDRAEWFDKLKKSGHVIGIAKAMVNEQKNCGINETEFTELISTHAQQLHLGMRKDAAFAQVISGDGEDALALRKALQIAKLSVFDVAPVIVASGQDAVDSVSDARVAMETLQDIGRKNWPREREAVQFARAIEDPANAELAAKAHRRPQPTTSHPFPR